MTSVEARAAAPIAQALEIKGVEKLLEGVLDGEGDHRFAVVQGLGGQGVAAAADHVAAGREVVQEAGLGVFFEVQVAFGAFFVEAVDHHF